MTKYYNDNQQVNEDMNQEKTGIFSELAGHNDKLHILVMRMRALWQRHANRRTKLIIIISSIIAILFYLGAVRPPENFPTNTLIEVKNGLSFIEIAESLEQQGVVRSAFATRLLAKIYRSERSVHSGDYLFKEPVSLLELMKRINAGAFGLDPVRIRIKDGDTVADVAKLLEKNMLKFDKEKFLAIASKKEGYLFPDTYYFLPNAPVGQMVGAMVDNFYNHFKEVEVAAAKTGLSHHELVTLASIVELEAWKYQDRRKIAGVMYNRLDINMPLQVDVSFVYIMNKGSFQVTRADMKHKSPYNTYVHKGLPPGPIGSPSMASLRAVVEPLGRVNNWIFYLADSSGITHYSKTYAQHLVKKRRYIDNR